MTYKIELRNSGGTLDVRIVDSEEETRAAVIEIASGLAYFSAGDMIIVTELTRD